LVAKGGRGRGNRARSISSRLIILLTPLLAVIVAIGMSLDYRLSRDDLLERLRTESQETIRRVVVELERWLHAVEGSTLFLARVLQQREYSRQELEQLLRDLVENNDDIYGAAIALDPDLEEDPGGFSPYYFRKEGILTYSELAASLPDYRKLPWYREAVTAGRPVWVEPYRSESGGGVPMTTFAVPVYRVDEAGQRFLYAVVTADVSLSQLQPYLQQLHLGERGFAILLSRTGIVLGSGTPEDILRHYSQTERYDPRMTAWQEMFSVPPEERVGARRIDCPDTRGDCVLILDRITPAGWPVAVAYSERDTLAPLRWFQFKATALGVATLLLMALTVYLVTHRLTRPLAVLAKASAAIARGELDAPLPATGGDDEVARLVRAFAAMERDLKRHIDELEAATASRSRLEGELAAASRIQMSLLPRGGEAGERYADCELWARLRPARRVGGDLYTYFCSGDRLLLAIGDVSDKGVPAALFMARVISLIPQLAGPDTAPGEAMARLNDALVPGNDNCMFVTLFLGVLDLDSHQLHFASAGHGPPTLVRCGAARVVPQESGPALGLEVGFDYAENALRLLPGDRLAVFTDGIDEAFNEAAQMFGRVRCDRHLALSCCKPLALAGEALFGALDRFTGATAQSDDIALLLLQIPPGPAGAGQVVARVSQRFPTGAWLNSRVQTWLDDALEGGELAPSARAELALVAEEVVSNIDKYAGLAAGETLLVTLETEATRIALEVADGGREFNPLAHARRATLGSDIDSVEIGGLGVHLITALTDEQSYRRCDGHNILRVVKLLHSAMPRAADAPPTPPQEAIRMMQLHTGVTVDEARSVARVSMDGALNTDTAPAFETCLQEVLDAGHQLTVLDMKSLDYISSAGLRVIFRAAKQSRSAGRKLAVANRKPHIDKVFEILRALPDLAVFASDAELETYLEGLPGG
jgi:sigma-B regulation protein RsbU (phosphoserine phosphatase)